MAKARQQYFADEVSIQKESREFAIEEELKAKIDSIEEGAQVNVIETVKVNGTALVPDADKAVDVDVPLVIDLLSSTSTTDALSANQGKILYEYIQSLQNRGRYLSNWNATTGLPTTNPSDSPYQYHAGDYYIVSAVAASGGTNYRPSGTSYTTGVASTVVESQVVKVDDTYVYDGTNWLLLQNTERQIAIDSSLSTQSTNPVENRVITNALSGKQPTLTAGANITIDANNEISAVDTTYSNLPAAQGGTDVSLVTTGDKYTWDGKQDALVAGNNISIAADGKTISAVDTTYSAGTNIQISSGNVISATDTTYSAGTGIDINGTTISNALPGATISATAPTNPAEGMLWYDTANDQLKSYDGTNWNLTGKIYTAGSHIDITSDVISTTGLQEELRAGENITIGNVCHKNTQGPCPNGFHIPRNWYSSGHTDEFANLTGVLEGLGISVTTENVMTYFKMPKTGYRGDNATVTYKGSSAYYRCSGGGIYAPHAYNLNNPTAHNNGNHAKYASPIRPFKDEPVVPDNSWVALYDGSSIATGAGIFWNEDEGLITMSSNGTNWYTIADKNLGATTVYNYGDELTEANCGNCFQHGNCHGFPFYSNITVSSTLADASGYGPGNYYYGDTFIDGAAQAWQSSNNDNLWGGNSSGTRCALTISATDTTYKAGSGISVTGTTISNTQPGAVVAASAPLTPNEGDLWYDTTNDALKSYDGTNWNEVGGTYTAGTNIQISAQNVISATDTTYTAGKGISIGDVDDYSAMRGPCPEGFHIPSNEERDALKAIMRDALGTRDGTNWIRHLHMPLSGFRNQTGGISNQGTSGIFWSSINDKIFALSAQDGYIGYGQGNVRGQSIRGFKDSYVEPDSTWTVSLGTLGSAGIFWNQSEGLISITNGSTGYTIMDKNLGATTVYNDGDTLTEANMGYVYQRGNNYGFPSTGTLSNTSSTKVDATNYGPGNYYSSSTFITGGYGENRDTSDNTNLRGGETGVISLTNAITNIGVTSINGQTGDVVLSSTEWGNITGTLSQQTDLQNALDGKVNVGLTKVFDSTEIEIGKWEDEGGVQSSGHHVTINPNGEVSTYNVTTGGHNDAILGSANLTLLENTVLGGDETTVISQDGITITEGNTTKTYDFLGNDRIATLSDISGSTGGIVDDTAYAASWDGVTTIAPSKNAVYDKLESMSAGIPVVASTTPSSATEGMIWYDSTNDVLKTYDGTSWSEAGTKMVVLSYGSSTWQDFIDAYDKNAIVYCKASSNSNPGTGNQGRMAFMAFVDINSSTQEIQGVEFQYYRSRSSHSTAANVLDEVYVYKLTPASGGTWTVTQRDTAAKPIAGTGIGLTYSSSGMTISADTSVLATQTYVDAHDTVVSSTTPSSPTEGMVWYDTTNDVLKVYNGSSWDEVGSGSGDVSGPGSSTDGNITVFDGATGKLIKDSGVAVSDLNTKTFYLSNTSDLTNAQAAYDWYAAGKNPIIVYDKNTYVVISASSSDIYFGTPLLKGGSNSYSATYQCGIKCLLFSLSSGTVTTISANSSYAPVGGAKEFLALHQNYSTPYTPEYNGSPATKKYVDDGDTYIGSSAPTSNLVEGRLRYDTTNDKLKVYDGTNWHNVDTDTDTTYTAGEGIEIINGADYSAMRGPAQRGFHIPSSGELSNLNGLMYTLLGRAIGNDYKLYLHMPLAGRRGGAGVGSAAPDSQGDIGLYHTNNTPNSFGYALYMTSSSADVEQYAYHHLAISIRAFKDTPVVPDNTWTPEYQPDRVTGQDVVGIYHNSTLGLISISGDGTTWVTIADKNIGATVVYDDGDALSEANCGKYYQWGNCYGFPFDASASITTTTTQVDASGYGPGNYYYSDEFFVVPTINGPFDWMSTVNYNLWGATTGVITRTNGITNTGVLSINGRNGDVVMGEFNPDNRGSTNQVLTKTASGYKWSEGPIDISSQANNILTSGMKIWAGSQSDYESLGSYDSNTVYLTI